MHLVTKDQALKILENYKVDSILPKKKEQKIIAFTRQSQYQTVIVTLSTFKSTYGKSLYNFAYIKNMVN